MNSPIALGIPTNGAEWLIIFLVVLLLFGSKKLPELARGLGKSMQEFRKAREDFESEIHTAKTELTVAEPAGQRQLHQNTSVAANAAMNQNDELQRQVRELQEQLRAMQGVAPQVATPAAPAPAAPAPPTGMTTPMVAAAGETSVPREVVGAVPVELTPVDPGAVVPPPSGTVPAAKLS